MVVAVGAIALPVVIWAVAAGTANAAPLPPTWPGIDQIFDGAEDLNVFEGSGGDDLEEWD